ncbi:ABC transporter permease [Streptacidiphilus monticola]|uniref:ABC transporter permease n=1 Tax=Streptacidiphilus monticola TaxID=2161674 RepID=A0ABW1G657_9ACTN
MAGATAVLTSEWTKVRTVRSTYVTLVLAFVVTVGLGAVISAVTAAQWKDMTAQERLNFDPTSTSFSGIFLGQLALLVFGVLVVGNEYSTGMIRVSLAAVPQRATLLLSKTATVLCCVLPVALATAFAAFLLGQALLGDHRTTLGADGVLKAVFGLALYMTLMSLLSLGVGFMLRKPVLSLGLLMPFFFLISPILNAVPGVKKVARYFPDQAGGQLVTVHHHTAAPYGWGAALGIVLAWTAACLVGGYLLLKRRDA